MLQVTRSIFSSCRVAIDCSPQTKKTFSPSFTRSLLSLIVITGLLHQTFHCASTSSPTLVSRAYDAYGQLTSEATSLNGSPLSSWTQTWDAAGRRTALNWNLSQPNKGAQYAFSYNALGEMTSSQNGSGTNSYTYSDNGLLSGKTSPFGKFLLARDKVGRIGEEAIQRNSDQATLLYEHMDWKSNDHLNDYKVLASALGFPQETRTYSYDNRGRIFQEPFMMFNSPNAQLLSNTQQNAIYFFDEHPFNNATGGTLDSIGVRTTQYINNNEAHRVTAETSFAQVQQDNYFDVVSGPTWKYSTYDQAGNVNSRSHSTGEKDTFIWDNFDHLVAVTQRGNNQYYDWNTTYDGLGRRIQTSYGGNIINYYYDPEVEFLELGNNINGSQFWNLYGPDRSGIYGGAQGIGGLECTYNETSGTTYDHVKNFFGDTIGIYTATAANRYDSVLGGYGAMPGSPVNGNLQPQWRGHYLDPTGFYYMGARYYDPQVGRFISPDPLGHSSSLGLYD